MRLFLLLMLLLLFGRSYTQTSLDSLMATLRQAEYYKIAEAKGNIVSKGKEAIPGLLKSLKDTSYIKLKNTADLIYPGAEKFYGHGGIVNYDIDWVAVRAAWLLEEITFQNFGYLTLGISEDTLMKLHKENYSVYLQTGSHDIDYKSKTPAQKLMAYRLMLAEKVSKWWENNKATWTRFKALKEAISNSDEERQRLALQYLRHGKTECDGLTIDSYEKEIKPVVEGIANSKNSTAQQATLLLDDKEYYWLKIKGKKN